MPWGQVCAVLYKKHNWKQGSLQLFRLLVQNSLSMQHVLLVAVICLFFLLEFALVSIWVPSIGDHNFRWHLTIHQKMNKDFTWYLKLFSGQYKYINDPINHVLVTNIINKYQQARPQDPCTIRQNCPDVLCEVSEHRPGDCWWMKRRTWLAG